MSNGWAAYAVAAAASIGATEVLGVYLSQRFNADIKDYSLKSMVMMGAQSTPHRTVCDAIKRVWPSCCEQTKRVWNANYVSSTCSETSAQTQAVVPAHGLQRMQWNSHRCNQCDYRWRLATA